MNTTVDLNRRTIESLRTSLCFHENDVGTTTTDQECRRMVLVERITAELTRRGESVR